MTVAKKSKRSVSYILGPTQFHQGHSLGVNALEFSKGGNTLFSAGRDGIVSSWSSTEPFGEIDYPLDNLDEKLSSYSAIHDYASSIFENETELLFLESQIRKGINFHAPQFGDYSMQTHAQIHSDWVNDIKVLSDNKSIVSCSSDLSVKIWDSTTLDKVSAIGYHTDYVRCLAYHKGRSNEIVSGSLDKSIAVWDIEKQHQITSIKDADNERGSIYALARLPNLVASGGPENIVRLYDSRARPLKPTKKFAGHQGNIKALILKNNLLLSGSADSTIKLWDLRTNRVLRTFDMHDSSVWSLECPDEENQSDDLFNVFYSGDRNGLIIKTDLKSCNYDYYYANNAIITGKLNDNLGISTVIADLSESLFSDDAELPEQQLTGALSLAYGDNSIWSSTSSVISNSPDTDGNTFIKRWAVPNTNKLITYQSIKLARNLSAYNKEANSLPMQSEPTDLSLTSIVSDPFHANNIVNDDLFDLVSHLSNNSTYDLSQQLDDTLATKPSNQFSSNKGEEESLISPFLATIGGPNAEFAISQIDSEAEDDEEDERVIILHNQQQSKTIRIIPIAAEPLQGIEGQSGLVKHRLLNNRRHVVTMDTSGTIEVWDLIKNCTLETISTSSSDHHDFHEVNDLLEYQFNEVIDKYQTYETLPMWCKVEIKSGKLFVTLEEGTFSNTEIYLDQLFSDFPSLEKQYALKFSPEDLEERRIGSRVNLGRMVLKNIFRKFIKAELLQDAAYRDSNNPDAPELTRSASNDTLELNIPEASADKSTHEVLESIVSNEATQSAAPPAVSAMPALTKKPSNDDHKRKFKFFGKSSRSGSTSSTVDTSKISSSPSTIATVEVPKELSSVLEESTYSVIQDVRAKYDSSSKYTESVLSIGELELPFVELPSHRNTLIIISEISNDSNHELFHGRLDDYLNEKTLITFEKVLPKWCGNALLLSKFPPVTYTKINFIVEQLKDANGESDLAPITQSSNRLNAVSVLRAHKIASFIIERLDEKPPESEQLGFKAYEFLELVCADQVVPFDMTLATIKARIWKRSSDVVLKYRRKQKVV